MADIHQDLAIFQEFREALGTRDPKTIATYLTTVHDFVAWLALQPGGAPFHLGLVTETAVRGYMEFLATTNHAPRTQSKALSALRRFGQWAVDEGHLRRNPARAMERPTVVAVAPTELSDKQRFVLKTMVEQHATPRFAAIFALGYWAGLRISEIAALRLDQCMINQRAGCITLLDAKGPVSAKRQLSRFPFQRGNKVHEVCFGSLFSSPDNHYLDKHALVKHVY